MYTTATVIKINDDNTVLVGCSKASCESCKAQTFCNNKDDTEFLARNDNKVEIKEGQIVTLFLPPGKTILSTILVFALPLAVFPIGYLLMKKFTNFNEVVCALSGFAMMGIVFALCSIIGVSKKRDLMPVIEL